MPRSRSPESSYSSSKRSKQSHHSSDRDRSSSPPPRRSDHRDSRDSDRRSRDYRDDDYRRSDRDRDRSDHRDVRRGDSERDRDRREREPDRRTSSSAHQSSSSSSSSSRLPPPPSSSTNGYGRHQSPSHHSSSSSSARLPATGSVASPSSSSVLPPRPDTNQSRPSPQPSTSTPASSEPSEEEKLRAKKERLAAWKAKQAAAKANSPAPSSPAPPSSSALPTPPPPTSKPTFASIPTKPTFSFGGSGGGAGAALSRIGLPLKPSALSKSTMAMDDGPAPVRKLEKLGALPAVDTKLVVPTPGDEDDDQELDYEFKASVKGGERVVGGGGVGGAAGAVEAMDVDPPALNGTSAAEPAKPAEEEDDEIDPLDAYMLGVTQERVKVDQEDSSRMKGGAAGAKRSRALGVDDDDEGAAEGSDEEVGAEEGDKPITAEDIIAAAAAKNRRKELPTVDHSVATYEPFRKAFYTPPYEVNEMTEDEVVLMRLEMDGIKIRGVDCPRPVKRWGAFGLPGGCLEVIKRLGYEEPTSIQAQAIPAIMSGRDVIGVAKTGSGKTIAFLLPLLRHINDQRPLESGEGPMAVILTPTRELALQIVKETKPFAKVLGITAMAAYGGSPISEQISEMKKGAEIVVGTPGRLIDLLTANSGRVTNLRRVTYLVLDEADRMFDMGFEPQVMKIINNIRPGRQIVLFSATFPKQMDGLARKILQKPLEVTVGGRSVVGKEIEQVVEVRTEETKFNRLLEILGETYQSEEDFGEKRTLIFVERQEAADNLLLQLHQKSYRRVNSLHGGKEQIDRDETINNFKSGVLPIVIATSVAARGLDVKQLVLVINYDVPNHMEDYVHRAGRTGRAGNKGTCVTFITPEQEKFSVDISRAVEASFAARVPPLPVPDRFADLKALADGFLAKVRSGAVKSFSNTGFGGKGLERFESDRESKEAQERSHFGEGKDEKKDGEGGKDDKAVGETKDGEFTLAGFNVDIVKGPAPERVRDGSGGSKGGVVLPAAIPQSLVAGGPNKEGLNKVQAALNKINAELAAKKKAMAEAAKNPAPAPAQPTGESTIGGVTQKTVLQMDRKPKDPDATDYHAVVMINDFVQKARWMVTNRESIVKLIDLTGTAITNRGVFYEPGKEPPPGGEPKLSLLIESNDEWRVEMAVKEIKRLLIEGTILGLAHEQRNPTAGGGRYKID